MGMLCAGCASRSSRVEMKDYDAVEPATLADYIRGVYELSAAGAAAIPLPEAPDAEQGLIALEAEVAADPANRHARANLAEAYLDHGRFDAAYAALLDSHIENPKDSRTNLNLARVWDAWGAYELALRYVGLAILEADTAQARDLAGRIHLHRDAPADAIASFRAALRFDERNAPLLANLGYACILTADWNCARASLEAALDIDPDISEARNNLAFALSNSGDDEAALAELMKTARPAAALNNMGVIYLRSNRARQARRSFEEALRLEPDYETARRNLQSLEPVSAPSIVHLPSFGHPEATTAAAVPLQAPPAEPVAGAPSEVRATQTAAVVAAADAVPTGATPAPEAPQTARAEEPAALSPPPDSAAAPAPTPVVAERPPAAPAAMAAAAALPAPEPAEPMLPLEHRAAGAAGLAGMLIVSGALVRRARRSWLRFTRPGLCDRRREKGAALVETAVVLPLLILVVIGMVELGLVLHDYLILQNASREGARFAAVGNPQAAVRQRVRDYAFQLDDESLDVEVVNAQGERGSPVTVRASYPVPLITLLMRSLAGVDNFGLQAESQMRLE
jgi:tetratricopeptide (TPR) repeat protein